MSDIIPSTILAKIEFFEQRLPDWAADPAAIGLTAPQISDLINRTTAARQAYSAAQQIRQQSRNATAVQNDAVSAMASFGSDLIATIRAFADLQTDPVAVFQSAEIDPPQPSNTPLPPPAPATDLAVTLLNTGAIRLTWKGTTANGTFYDVYRRLGEAGSFALIGSSATRGFDDTTLPAGTASATYYTVARRDAFSSDASVPALVRFGNQASANQASSQGGDQSGNGQFGLAA